MSGRRVPVIGVRAGRASRMAPREGTPLGGSPSESIAGGLTTQEPLLHVFRVEIGYSDPAAVLAVLNEQTLGERAHEGSYRAHRL